MATSDHTRISTTLTDVTTHGEHGEDRALDGADASCWIVERTFGWLNRCRRLAKDVENRIRSHFAFVQIAMIRIMMRRIARHSAH